MVIRSLADAMLEENNLLEAWCRVKANEGMGGVDGVTIGQFSAQLFTRLISLRDLVMKRSYRPQPLLEVRLEQEGKKPRMLAVPTVRDRVLQTAVARVLTPLFEKEFEQCSYAYRIGRSVPMAVARVAHFRDQGYRWVVDADISHFFDHIQHPILLAKLRRTLSDHTLLPLIELWLNAEIQASDGQKRLLTQGVPQGSPLSPLLANLYLDEFDELLLERQQKIVRFADDFVILCKGLQEAEEALELTEEVMTGLRLTLNQEKTRIVHFDLGFRFLGIDFIRNLLIPAHPESAPWLLPHPNRRYPVGEPSADTVLNEEAHTHAVLPPEDVHESSVGRAQRVLAESVTDACLDGDTAPMEWEEYPELEPIQRSVYLIHQGCWVSKEGERISISKDRELIYSIPLGKVDQLVIHGNQMISSALLRHCAKQGIAVHFCDHGGTTRGSFIGHGHEQVDLLRYQFHSHEQPDVALMLAQSFVDGKIHNSRLILRRYNRQRQLNGVTAALQHMDKLRADLPASKTLDQVRGLEGMAARWYFSALSELLAPDWYFARRDKRPAGDPINSMLSFGYAVLYQSVASLIRRRGLHPQVGALHQATARYEPLAADLMEEFRAPVVDSVVLAMALNDQIKPSDFTFDGNDDKLPCKLGPDIRRTYLSRLEAKFRAGVIHPRTGLKMDYRRAIQFQIHHYARVIKREEPVYYPCKFR